MAVRLQPITPDNLQRINPAAIRRDIKRALQAESEQHRRMFKQATSTWNNPPTFSRRTEDTGDTISSILSTKSVPFAYVELGTKVRYMHMSRDFTPKSTPGSLRARTGSGRAVGLGFPRPGIQARGFRNVIAKKREGILAAKIAAIIIRHTRV